jgi:hypothetical protein
MPMLNILQYGVGGTPLGLQTKEQFIGSINSWPFGIFMLENGEDSFYIKNFPPTFVNFILHNAHVMQFFHLRSF